MLDDIRAVIDPTITCFNRLVAAGNVEQAARYADALADLLPGNDAALNSALSCNVALGRKQRAAQLAASLAGVDPAHQRHPCRIAAAAPPPPAQSAGHPLIQLRDLYDQASAILCGPLTEQGVDRSPFAGRSAQAGRCRARGFGMGGWEKHYRLALKAIDMSRRAGPDAAAVKRRQNRLRHGIGPASWTGAACRPPPKACGPRRCSLPPPTRPISISMAAPYIELILEHSDVSSLIVLHVIGGAKNLAGNRQIAGHRQQPADPSPATHSTPAASRHKCYDAPPKGLSAMPHRPSAIGALPEGRRPAAEV